MRTPQRARALEGPARFNKHIRGVGRDHGFEQLALTMVAAQVASRTGDRQRGVVSGLAVQDEHPGQKESDPPAPVIPADPPGRKSLQHAVASRVRHRVVRPVVPEGDPTVLDDLIEMNPVRFHESAPPAGPLEGFAERSATRRRSAAADARPSPQAARAAHLAGHVPARDRAEDPGARDWVRHGRPRRRPAGGCRTRSGEPVRPVSSRRW